jgi:hypothetical protein
MNEQIKYEMPQVNSETGVSADYSNEITPIRNSFMKGDREQIIKRIKNIKKYQERYPVNLYNNVITEKNKDAIGRLSHLADQMHQLAQGAVFKDNEFIPIYNEMIRLIYGPQKYEQLNIEDFGKSKR